MIKYTFPSLVPNLFLARPLSGKMFKLLLIFPLYFLVLPCSAQEITVAEKLYNEARLAFYKKEYEVALRRLQESEVQNDHLTPQVLYLRIQVLYNMLSSPFYRGTYSLLELKRLCELYQENYQGEDQFYRRVCNIYAIFHKVEDKKLASSHANDKVALLEVGVAYYYAGKTDVGKKWLEAAAEFEYAPAMLELGLISEMEDGNSFKEALGWYMKAAALGEKRAPFFIGSLYLLPLEENQLYDVAKAEKWFLKGAALAEPLATASLAGMYMEGPEETEKKVSKAVFYYKRAYQLGSSSSARTLGNLYYEGEWVTQDYHRALTWYKKAAEGNDVYAIQQLAKMYREGIGSIKDEGLAKEWEEKAGALKVEEKKGCIDSN